MDSELLLRRTFTKFGSLCMDSLSLKVISGDFHMSLGQPQLIINVIKRLHTSVNSRNKLNKYFEITMRHTNKYFEIIIR